MAANIKLKRSSVTGKIPTDSDLSYGELALNYADGRLYYKNTSNDIASISGGGAETDSAAPTSALQDGSLWWDAVNGRLKIYYIEPAPTATTISLTAYQSDVQSGDYLFTGTDRQSTYSSTGDPTIYLYKGDTLEIVNNATSVHPLWLVSQLSITSSYDALYNIPGVTNNGGYDGITTSYQFNSVGTYYYICQFHPNMQGQIIVQDGVQANTQWVDASPAGRGYTGSAGAIFQGETAPSNPSDGQIWYNSSTGKSYIYYTNPASNPPQSQWVLQADPTVSDGDIGYTGSVGYVGSQGVFGPRNISFQNPANADTQTLIYTNREVTINEVRSVISGGTSAAISLKWDSDRGSTGTTIMSETVTDSGGGSVATLSNNTVDANRWIWAEVGSVSGSVKELSVNVRFNE